VFLNVGLVLDRGIRIGGVEGHLSAPMFGIVSDSAALEYIVSACSCLTACFAGLTAVSVCAEGERVTICETPETSDEGETENKNKPALQELLHPRPIAGMKGIDWLLMLGVTAVYAVAAFTNLGAVKSPQTWWRSESPQDSVVLDLGESHAVNMLYLGGIHRQDQEFIVRVSEDGESWSEPYWAEITEGDCFKWKYLTEASYYDGQHTYGNEPEMLFGRYVRIEAQLIGTTIYEVILRDPETQAVYPVTLVSGDGANLIDEQDAFFGEPGWYNSTYFDEIYHARTGYEHYLAMQGDYTYMPYETSHPPLGKVLIALSISVFGMTPFGWRFAGALAGVLMLPGMYLLGKLLTKRRLMAFAAMFLMAVDFMHFTQTRIATIDSFVVLFILWSYVFMVYYLRMDYWDKKLWRTLVPLFLSGLCMGLAVASKWTGCYAGVGLALLFFWSLYRRFTQSLEARDMPATGRAAAAAGEIYRRPIITLLCCLVFFVAVPLGIYYISYIPYFLPYTPSGVTVKRVIQAAVGDYFESGFMGGMLGYHSTPGLGMDHPFYSPWYEWPIIKKPMWYYSSAYRTAGTAQTIVAFGNPLVWWGGLAAMLAVILVWLLRHASRHEGITLHTGQNDMRPAILLISFAAQFVPWVLVPRGTYIYHYFPSVPFIILAISLCLDLLADAWAEPVAGREGFTLRLKRVPGILTVACMLVALALFAAFFPYISGITASTEWLRAMQWFRGWIYY
ncbi:MAG: phospholipid carrier-dependent glycosyltransferase, partial [Clostridia bacterium]|nr:phospholipid carrier-dependent glycosyltransferase [Clostridia bacterium]